MPRHGPRTTADRLRDQTRRANREHARRIVDLSDRPLDDGIVDHTAIELALRGWTHIAARLRRAELFEAVAHGMRRGIGGPEMADLLLLHEREVERIRAQVRARARETVAA
jgi:hypothetical protein